MLVVFFIRVTLKLCIYANVVPGIHVGLLCICHEEILYIRID